jgi:selenide, water dikinase
LRKIVQDLDQAADPNLLVGFGTADDAGVYRIDDTTALVQTVDFITPVVDDPDVFGQVAAANSLSDVYAMGGRPLTAMNVCCFPSSGIPTPVLAEILKGGARKVREAGAVVVGGHTIQDPELKYGLAVTGIVDPNRIVRNSTAQGGDALVLTKPIGTGVVISAYRERRVSDATLREVLEEMVRLNDVACRLMLEHGVHACTDVTGFGLLGHALGMAERSGAGLRIRMAALPFYPESLALIRKGIGTRVTRCNLKLAEGKLKTDGRLPEEELTLLADPQTSGGLLIATPPEEADALVAALAASGHARAARIGEVFAESSPRLEIVGA